MRMSIKSLQTSFASTIVRAEVIIVCPKENIRTELSVAFCSTSQKIEDYSFKDYNYNDSTTECRVIKSGYFYGSIGKAPPNLEVHQMVKNVVGYCANIMTVDMNSFTDDWHG